MAYFKVLFCFLFVVFCQGILSQPVEDDFKNVQTKTFRWFMPGVLRERRGEEEQQPGPLRDEPVTPAKKEGGESGSSMILGTFSLMSQPMPSGSQFANQLMNLIPGLSGK